MRRMSVLLSLMLLCMLAFGSLAMAQTAAISVEAYSPQEIHDLGWSSPRSTGLSVVGLGQVVYLVGSDSAGAAVTGYAWTLTEKPTGSTAVLDSTDTKQITFKPDMVGKYTVSLVVTTAGGTSAAKSATVTAAKFVGLGELSGGTSNPSAGQCGLCHFANLTEWQNTGHATMFTRAIDGLVSTHYGESCIECHTTGFDETPSAANDGFDDIATNLGWVFPAELKAGNWDSLKTKYPTLAQRANIQCEACHGPGSEHKGDKSKIDMSLDEGVCGYCHEEDPYHRKNQQWKASLHAVGVTSASNNPSCTRCHSGWGFVRRIDELSVDNRPTKGVAQITCAVCHDPHNAELPHQVRSLADVTLPDGVTKVTYGGMGKLCMQCHQSRRDAEGYASDPSNISTHFGPHHSNQTDMLDGSNAIEYGIPIGSSGHKFAAADACVTCHMAATPATGQAGHDKVGEHTFAMHWDGGTPDDPSDDVENVAVCQSCHGGITSFDDIMAKADFDEDGTIESTRHEIEGLLEKLGNLLPPAGPTVVTTKADYDWTGQPPAETARRQALLKAAYNYFFVEDDASMGVHNAGYAIALLRRSIASLTTGDIGSGEIISITDVPNDQGKQVRVAWSKFPGDGLSANPVAGYSLWRKVDAAAAAASVQVISKEAMLAQAGANGVGKRYHIAQEGSWDFVTWIPASGYETYSVVAPTLFDSTAAGKHWSYFFVAGHMASQTVETAIDSGYSVDNLVPSAPQNIAINVAKTAVNFKWDEPIDPDFKYFAVYRSTNSGFDPKGMTPYATLTANEYVDNNVTVSSTYYYRFSTYDFSGNQSLFSSELSAIITSVGEGKVPTTYALEQNYPNPFNPETTIKFQVPATTHIRLSVYTALGQEIRTLVDRVDAPGVYSVVWDGRDNVGNAMSSGVYFYRIQADNFVTMKKMIMMK